MITTLGTGGGLVIDLPDPSSIVAKLNKLMSPTYIERLLDAIGALVESQTKRRIRNEKADPAGDRWVPWSDDYAEKRPAGKSLLEDEGNLLTSITHESHTAGFGDNYVEVGSNLVYAAVHNYGATFSIVSNHAEIKIPKRQFLGLSLENESAVDKLVADFVRELI